MHSMKYFKIRVNDGVNNPYDVYISGFLFDANGEDVVAYATDSRKLPLSEADHVESVVPINRHEYEEAMGIGVAV